MKQQMNSCGISFVSGYPDRCFTCSSIRVPFLNLTVIISGQCKCPCKQCPELLPRLWALVAQSNEANPEADFQLQDSKTHFHPGGSWLGGISEFVLPEHLHWLLKDKKVLC